MFARVWGVVAGCVIVSGCVPHLTSKDNGEPTGTWSPPENSWTVGEPPSDLEGEGFAEGEYVPDFLLQDQNGDDVSLWQFYGLAIVLDISTMWCSPCQDLAEEAEATYQDYKDLGMVYITVLPEDAEGADPTVEDLQAWVDAFHLTSPVVGDPGKEFSGEAVPDDSYPMLLVIDQEMRVYEDVVPPSDAGIRDALDELL